MQFPMNRNVLEYRNRSIDRSFNCRNYNHENELANFIIKELDCGI